MRLLTAHKILISAAIAATAAFAGYEAWVWRWTRAPAALAAGAVGMGVALGLALYLRRLLKKGAGGPPPA